MAELGTTDEAAERRDYDAVAREVIEFEAAATLFMRASVDGAFSGGC
jgi:hypothetical protein